MRRAAAIVAALLLGACVPEGEEGRAPAEGGIIVPQDVPEGRVVQPDAGDPCGAARYRGLIGSDVGAAGLSGGPRLRVIGPDDAVTLDFLAERANVYVREDGTVERVECG